jgi:hypothetical protein
MNVLFEEILHPKEKVNNDKINALTVFKEEVNEENKILGAAKSAFINKAPFN